MRKDLKLKMSLRRLDKFRGVDYLLSCHSVMLESCIYVSDRLVVYLSLLNKTLPTHIYWDTLDSVTVHYSTRHQFTVHSSYVSIRRDGVEIRRIKTADLTELYQWLRQNLPDSIS